MLNRREFTDLMGIKWETVKSEAISRANTAESRDMTRVARIRVRCWVLSEL